MGECTRPQRFSLRELSDKMWIKRRMRPLAGCYGLFLRPNYIFLSYFYNTLQDKVEGTERVGHVGCVNVCVLSGD